jgi:hypothetical protein
MKALSIKPPWGYFIIYGIPYGVAVDNGDGSQSVKDSGKVILKDIENRNWRIGRSPQHGPYSSYHRANFRLTMPARIQIHVSKQEDPIEYVLEFAHRLGIPYGSIISAYSKLLPRGAIIGEVDIVDCVTESQSPWFVGPYGFVLRNPAAYKEPIPCRGMLGFFEPTL